MEQLQRLAGAVPNAYFEPVSLEKLPHHVRVGFFIINQHHNWPKDAFVAEFHSSVFYRPMVHRRLSATLQAHSERPIDHFVDTDPEYIHCSIRPHEKPEWIEERLEEIRRMFGIDFV